MFCLVNIHMPSSQSISQFNLGQPISPTKSKFEHPNPSSKTASSPSLSQLPWTSAYRSSRLCTCWANICM